MKRTVELVPTVTIAALALWLLFATLSLAAPTLQTAYPPDVTIDQPLVGEVFTTAHLLTYPIQGKTRPGTLGGAPIVAVSLTLDGGLTYSPVVTVPPAWSWGAAT